MVAYLFAFGLCLPATGRKRWGRFSLALLLGRVEQLNLTTERASTFAFFLRTLPSAGGRRQGSALGFAFGACVVFFGVIPNPVAVFANGGEGSAFGFGDSLLCVVRGPT